MRGWLTKVRSGHFFGLGSRWVVHVYPLTNVRLLLPYGTDQSARLFRLRLIFIRSQIWCIPWRLQVLNAPFCWKLRVPVISHWQLLSAWNHRKKWRKHSNYIKMYLKLRINCSGVSIRGRGKVSDTGPVVLNISDGCSYEVETLLSKLRRIKWVCDSRLLSKRIDNWLKNLGLSCFRSDRSSATGGVDDLLSRPKVFTQRRGFLYAKYAVKMSRANWHRTT